MTIDPTIQRRVMGCFATGVTLVTTRFGTQPSEVWGMTANSFTSLSLDPPLVLISVDRKSTMYEYLKMGMCFAVNVLSTQQEAISRRFAMRGPKDFEGIDCIAAVTGAPILVGALAYIDCHVHTMVAGGDHDIVIGAIAACAHGEGQPLLFYGGRYSRLALSGSHSISRTDTGSEQAYDLFAAF